MPLERKNIQVVIIRGADYIIKVLELLDAGCLFAYPGGAVLPIYDALAFSKLKSVLVRHEQAASFGAQGYARTFPNKPGFCLATSGPGATNLVTGLADAYGDNIPVIALTGQVPSHLIGSDAFQETDITGICMPFTKKTFILKDLENVQEIFTEAYEISINGRPGPVLIDIPKNVQEAEIELDDNWESQFKFPVYKRLVNPHQPSVDKAINLISKAKKPLIISGHGILQSDACQELRDFIDREQIPAVSTILGMGAIESDNPLYFSWLGMHGMKYANLAVQESDCIIALGIRFDDRITGKLSTFAPNADIVHVDIDEGEASKNVPTRAFIHSDLKIFLQDFPCTLTNANKMRRSAWINELNELKDQFPIKEPKHDKMTMIAAIDLLAQLESDDMIVATDVGQHQMWSGQYLQHLKPHSFLTSGGLGSMGFGLPAAMGAVAAQPQRPVWCISGDGSFQMNLQELMTLVQEKWPVKILVLDNTYLGMVRQWQEQFYEKNYSGVDLVNPDYKLLAEAYGIKSVTVDNIEDYKKAIDEAKNHDGPFMLHARVLKEDNVFPMVPPQQSLSDTMYYPKEKELITK